MLFASIILALATSQLVAGHGAIVAATGDAGGAGQAIGGMYSFLLLPPGNLLTSNSCQQHSS